jgi:hypothetical protein
MNRRVSYKVSWTSGGRAGESRRFDEWEPAAEFYAGLVGDRRCDLASLVEVTETEVRCFEREAARGSPAGAPVVRGDNPGRRKSNRHTRLGRTWLTDTADSP